MSHWSLRPGCTAAFSVDGGAAGEQAVVVAETAPEAAGESEKIIDLIRGAISEAHGCLIEIAFMIRFDSPTTIIWPRA